MSPVFLSSTIPAEDIVDFAATGTKTFQLLLSLLPPPPQLQVMISTMPHPLLPLPEAQVLTLHLG